MRQQVMGCFMRYANLIEVMSHSEAIKRLRSEDSALIALYSTIAELMERHLWMTVDEDPMPSQDKIYRVSLEDGCVEVVCLGLDSVDSEGDGQYDSVDNLPDWMQEKLSTLYLFKCEGYMPIVEGVGRRISKDVFWLFVE